MNIKKITKEIISEIKKHDVVYITGHKNLDLDAIGAMIGMYILATFCKKKSYFIIDDKKHEESVSRALEKIKNKIPIRKTEDLNIFGVNPLLIIVDTNKPYLLQNEELLNIFRYIIVIDHHDKDKEIIKASHSYIIENVSSTCELIVDILSLKKIKLLKDYATIILSGIVLDTNNFTLKTNDKTYKAAYYLTNNNASNNEVQYLLKQDLKKYINRQKMLYDIDVVSKNVAITKGNKKDKFKREDLAKIADTLLQFEKIEASFVVGFLEDDKLGISARSIGKVDVSSILKKFNGGGTSRAAAVAIDTKDIDKVFKELKQFINKL